MTTNNDACRPSLCRDAGRRSLTPTIRTSILYYPAPLNTQLKEAVKKQETPPTHITQNPQPRHKTFKALRSSFTLFCQMRFARSEVPSPACSTFPDWPRVLEIRRFQGFMSCLHEHDREPQPRTLAKLKHATARIHAVSAL